MSTSKQGLYVGAALTRPERARLEKFAERYPGVPLSDLVRLGLERIYADPPKDVPRGSRRCRGQQWMRWAS